MRIAVVAILSLGLSASSALAGQPAADFHATSAAFEQSMRRMADQMADPANRDRTRRIAAAYQADADAFAAVIEMRKAAGLPVTGAYANARAVRALPGDLSREATARQRADRFTPRAAPEFTRETTPATGFSHFTPSPRL